MQSTNDETTQMQQFCKNLIKTKIFIGNYIQRRYVEKIDAYRDIIVINNSEVELQEDLGKVKVKIESQNPDTWIGITNANYNIIESGDSWCIWTEIDTLPFGMYWFQIKTIRFRENEVQIKIKTIRPINTNDYNNINVNKSKLSTSETIVIADDWYELFYSWKNSINELGFTFLKTSINRNTFAAIFKFCCLLILSISAGSVHGVKYLGFFTLRLINELTKLIHVLTPLFLGVLDLITKIIGGFYILLSMIWRDSVRPTPRPVPHNSIMWNKKQSSNNNRYN